MQKWNGTQAPRALNRGGAPGTPLTSGKTDAAVALPATPRQNAIPVSPPELRGHPGATVVIPKPGARPLTRPVEFPEKFDGSFIPDTWQEAGRKQEERRAESNDRDRVIAEYNEELEAGRKRKPSPYALSSGILTARFWAWLFALLLALAILGWVGLEVAEAVASAAPHLPIR